MLSLRGATETAISHQYLDQRPLSTEPPPRPTGIPVAPLLAMMAMQTLATMAAYSLPAAAPAVAADLGVEGTLIGFFVSLVYGVGILSAILSPGFIHRYGGVRVGQVVLIAVLAMLLTAPTGTLAALALSAVLLGLGYGATAPVSTHIIVPRTPTSMLNLVLSIRQIGVPLGGVMGSLIVPPLVLLIGWQPALLLQVAPVLLLLLILQIPRRAWDSGRDPTRPIFHGGALRPLRLLRENAGIRRLSIACFLYSGMQLCFVAFMAVHLTQIVGLDLVLAGQILATYQISGVVSRPIWGWLADNVVPALRLLSLHGLIMGAAALAAGQFGPDWPVWWIVAVAGVAGTTASGFTGIAYSEYARQGGAQRTEATAVGSSVMFAGVMLLPSTFGVLVPLLGGYGLTYPILGALCAASGLMLLRSKVQ